MELFKNIAHSKRNRYFFFLFGFFLLMNSLKSLSSENKFHPIENQKNYDFDKAYFQNSIPYWKYDSFHSQLKLFFGEKTNLPKSSYYPDLNIINDSDALRSVYRLKLNDMIFNEYHNNLKK